MKFRYFLFDCKYTEISWIVRNNFDYNKCKSLEGGGGKENNARNWNILSAFREITSSSL